MAASYGHLDIVLWLLKKKRRVKIDSTDWESRWNALHRAAYFGHVGILIPLIKNGVSLEQLDFDKFSPLNVLHYNFETLIRNTKCKFCVICHFCTPVKFSNSANLFVIQNYVRSPLSFSISLSSCAIKCSMKQSEKQSQR